MHVGQRGLLVMGLCDATSSARARSVVICAPQMGFVDSVRAHGFIAHLAIILHVFTIGHGLISIYLTS